jgi:phosphoenolpyruvate carboxykinase (ATP)
LIALPYDKIDTKKYSGELRKKKNGKTSDMVIALDCDRKIGLVYGSAYCGSMKKLLFTAMNYLLPDENILPLHCSANVDDKGNSALFLGLSGTGKTTLSTDAKRKMIGDDEHGWCNDGIANFEGGCYAKLIDLDPKKEPEIHQAVFTKRQMLENGVIIENAMMYPNGKFDLYDDRLAQNSRAGYPLRFLTNIKEDSKAGHPKTILFLTADANGVLPPISKLTKPQAMLWFMMGYTSKLAGTEVGITEPVSSFSRFFGQPFMPRNPEDYAKLLGEKMDKHNANVFLLNTGWSGGPYGVGKRMDIVLTRRLVDAALNGELDDVEYEEDELFHVLVPKSCPGVEDEILQPKNTWKDKREFDKRAEKLANDFLNHFYNAYGKANIDEEVKKQCPGK